VFPFKELFRRQIQLLFLPVSTGSHSHIWQIQVLVNVGEKQRVDHVALFLTTSFFTLVVFILVCSLVFALADYSFSRGIFVEVMVLLGVRVTAEPACLFVSHAVYFSSDGALD